MVIWTGNILPPREQQMVVIGKVDDGTHGIPFALIDAGSIRSLVVNLRTQSQLFIDLPLQ